jgi:hypothetical protein
MVSIPTFKNAKNHVVSVWQTADGHLYREMVTADQLAVRATCTLHDIEAHVGEQ